MAKVGLGAGDVEGLGMGVPGMIDSKAGTVIYSNNLAWEDFAIGARVGELTGLSVKIANDANVAALGEVKFGVAKEYSNAILLTLGTGVGGGIVVDGKLVEGNRSAGAELGHSVIVMGGEQCTCGRKGCLEAYASATALIRDTKRAMLLHSDSKMWEIGRARPYVAGDVSRIEMEGLVDTMDLRTHEAFPSGHSQINGGVTLGIATHYRKRWLWILMPIITLGVMWSRVYLGVHYLSDTLCGAALGVGFAFLWDILYQKVESKKYWIALGFSVLSIIFMIITPTKSTFEHAGMLIAGAIALPLEAKFVGFENATCAKNRIFRALVGGACVGIVFAAFSLLPFAFLEEIGWKFVKYFLTVLVAALFVPFLFKKLKI